VVFDRKARVDLGGVTARLFWLGAAHTDGDELTYVEEDSTLIPGDVVQNKLVPHDGNGFQRQKLGRHSRPVGTIKTAAHRSRPRRIGRQLTHRTAASVSTDLESRTVALKHDGKSEDDTAKLVGDEINQKYPDWSNMNNLPDTVKKP